MMGRVVAVLAALVVCAIASRVEPIPTDKCAASVITGDDDQLYVFSLSEDSVIWFKFQKKQDGWSTWRPLADRKKMGSGPKAIRFANGTLMVFARGTDRKFYSTILTDKQATDWSLVSDATFSSPPVPVVTTAGSVALFGTSAETHSTLYTESTPISSEEGIAFGDFAPLSFQESTSSPAVLMDGEGLLHVFIRGTNRGLWHIAETYSHPEAKKWSDWECLGGIMASSPSVPVTLNGVGLVEVYGRAADKALWHRSQTAQQAGTSIDWASWTSLGGVLASAPAVAVDDTGMTNVFARATDKAIYFKSKMVADDDTEKHGQWSTLGGMFSTAPSTTVLADGTIAVFARGVDKAIWWSRQIETNGTKAYTSWHSLGGHTRKYAC